MYRIKVLLSLAVILSITSASIAFNTIYVDANSPNNPGSGTYEDPFRKIQDAIYAAVDEDIIEIQPGLYTGYGNYDLDPNGKSITIRSIDPNNMVNTIIDPNGAGRGFCFQNDEDANCILSGFTIRNGYAEYNSGGGIYCYNSRPLITNCIITNNSADLYGGGIYCYDASPQITHCIIRNNSTVYDGGGIECSGGTPEFTNCLIINNEAAGLGGGADFYYLCNPTLTNCTIAKNYAYSGGGVCCTDSNVAVQNSILWQNQADQGKQIAMELPISDSTVLTISYSDVQGGQVEVYDPCTDLVWASGNISADPCFVSFDPNNNFNTWDFHLQSAYGRWNQNSQTWVTDSNTSLCIDAGDPNSDWSGEPWPNGKRINMGVYGGTTQASKNGNPADFNIDNSVNFVDFAQIAHQWLLEQTCIEDLNNDGDVNFADIYIFVENWLWEKN